MNRKIIVRIAFGCLAAIVLAVGALAATLIFPGKPSAARSLKFEDFVVLPKSTHFEPLTILDYLSVSGHDLFVTNVTNGDVYKIAFRGRDLPTASDIATFHLEPAAHGVAIDPVSRLAYVTHSEANTVDVFDPATMRLSKRIAVADDPDGIFYDSIDRLIYVANGGAKLATLIDPAKQTAVATIPLGGEPEFAVFDVRRKSFYQNLKDRNAIAIVDVANRAVVGRWPVPSCEAPTGIAIDPAGDRLFVVCSGNSKLVVLDVSSRRVIAVISVGGGPDAVAFDSSLHRIYVTGRSGNLSVILQSSPDAYRVLDLIHLHYGAHTLAVDPATHRLFTAYASLLIPPRIAVFSPQ